ncbi:MAG TPA: sigma-70 family RNA polymerase sigma factor [Terriglobia bacterium]|nr:sigma-70 family RNA polymerase sigma factor [Terriglobia bacterium]
MGHTADNLGGCSGRLSASTRLTTCKTFQQQNFAPEPYRAAFRLLHDQSKANDAVQETYLSAWKSFHRYERGTNCRAWMFQILFNVVRHERRQWFKWLTGRDKDLKDLPIFAPEPIPAGLTDKDILNSVDRLPRQFREVLLLVDVEEFSYKEASTILHVPIGTVMSRISRARTLLRSELTP